MLDRQVLFACYFLLLCLTLLRLKINKFVFFEVCYKLGIYYEELICKAAYRPFHMLLICIVHFLYCLGIKQTLGYRTKLF